MLDQTLKTIQKFIPRSIFNFFRPPYHYSLSIVSAIIYNFPSKKIKVIGVTGTKGKSTVTEIINAGLEEAGFKTAISNTIRYKVGDESHPNKFKMSMPGRFFIQSFLKKASDQKCDYVVMEMTSQGVLNYRHTCIELDALVFTNLSPEHIEAHGSYENYRDSKLELARSLSKSIKKPRILIANADDKETEKFLAFDADIKKTFTINNSLQTPLLGDFNKYNISAAFELCKALGVDERIIRKAILNFKDVPGRVEFIEEGQPFKVVVDYAHTADSMEKFYQVFKTKNTGKNICVFGATGGGRDTWKRKEMGAVADKYCQEILLTDDDAYDEDPAEIAEQIAEGIIKSKPQIIVDRREAIATALKMALPSDNVLITGKGTDAFLMGRGGKKTPWSDAQIVREELAKLS